jgi:acetyl-CoA C-acetyltransferase
MLHSKVLSQAFSSTSVYVVAGKRTPIGSFLGKLSKFKATELSSLATEGALKSINLDPSHIDEVILGNVIAAG